MSVINFNQAKAEKEAQISGEEIGLMGMLEAVTGATQVAILNAKEETFREILKEAGLDYSILEEEGGAEKLKKQLDDLGLALIDEGDTPRFESDDEAMELHFIGGWALFNKDDADDEEAEPVHAKMWKITHQFAGGDEE
ncbi:hypothetical protein F400_gp050 [Bacillus phage BCD7]|uniref:Uncharacterized protein n=1 Tax=Bacillus phage BCD7 TaxID=1136534 RepID=J9PUD0_9CAUD|nr:hypothetical protein F400_gp050 [Bacillus phage BCD7]AEZ50497.1 hypothetical protein BCD7_0050 [Bacillus phage BCD7]